MQRFTGYGFLADPGSMTTKRWNTTVSRKEPGSSSVLTVEILGGRYSSRTARTLAEAPHSLVNGDPSRVARRPAYRSTMGHEISRVLNEWLLGQAFGEYAKGVPGNQYAITFSYLNTPITSPSHPPPSHPSTSQSSSTPPPHTDPSGPHTPVPTHCSPASAHTSPRCPA